VLLLIALAIRVTWGQLQPAELSPDLPDQMEYRALASHLIVGDGLQFFDERFHGTEYAFRAPGYPMFMAMMGTLPRTVRLGQALLDTSTVLAIYLLARRWLDERAALVAAGLVAFNPFLIFFTGVMLSETLFTAAIAWGISLLGRKSWTGALCLAVAVLVRPAAMFLPPLLGAVAALLPGREGATDRPVRDVMGGLFLGAAASFVVLLPWAFRNHRVIDQWIWTTTNAGQTTYDGFHNGATGKSDLSILSQMPELLSMSETGRNRYLGQLGYGAMCSDPARSLSLAVTKVGRTWSPVPLSDEYGSIRNQLVGLIYAGPLFLLALVGLFRRNLSWPLKSLCLLPAIYFTAGVMMTVGSLRYRIPAEPPMCLLAAGALCRKSEGRMMNAE